MPEIFGPEGVNFYGKRGVNAADPIHDKDVVNLRTLQWFLEKAEFSAITASGGSSFVQIGNQGGGVPVYWGISGNTQIFNSFSAGTNLGVLPGAAITYYLQPNISVSGLTAQTITMPSFSANCNDIVVLDCNGNFTHSAGTTIHFANLSAGTSIDIISGTPKLTIRHTIWETGRTTANGPYSTNSMSVQLQKGSNASYGNFSIVAGSNNQAGGNYSTILNGRNNTISPVAPYSTILGGTGHTILKSGSAITGGRDITISLSANTTAVPYLRIANIYQQGPSNPFQFLTIDNNGYVYKTGLTISSVSGLSFVNLDSANAPNGNIYSFQNLGNVYLRSLTSSNYVGLTQTANHINISLTGINSLYNYWISGTGVSSIMSRRSGNTATSSYSFTQGHNNRSGGAYSVVFGHSNSAITGSHSSIFNGHNNYAGTGSYATVLNGLQNTAKTNFATVINGFQNNIKSGVFSSIINGKNNDLRSSYTIMGSGYFHTARTNASFGLILNGKRNQILDTASSGYNIIGNGTDNQTEFVSSTVINGASNFARGGKTTIINGQFNTARTGFSTIVNGNTNYISSLYGLIGNGISNSAQTTNPNYSFATVINGRKNRSAQVSSTIINGRYGLSSGVYSFIGNGKNNSATTTLATVLNGQYNAASALYSFVGNGKSNNSSAKCSMVGNGLSNSATSIYSTVLNGKNNYLKGGWGVIVNGWLNSASTTYFPFIGTGYKNVVNSMHSSVISGKQNEVFDKTNGYSVIAGGLQNVISSGLTTQTTNNLNFIANGYKNKISGGTKNFIANGAGNRTYSYSVSFIGNGNQNRILNSGTGTGAETILNGNLNTAETSFSTVINGVRNQSRTLYSLIGNGRDNTIVRNTSDTFGSQTVLNGWQNIISATTGSYISSFSQILNGSNQKIFNAYRSNIVGGGQNTISGDNYSFIGAGSGNQLIKNNSGYTVRRNSVLGGSANRLYNALYSISLGGIQNIGGGYANAMLGGKFNNIYKARNLANNGTFLSIIGGYGNYIKKGNGDGVFSSQSRLISGGSSFILGGIQNVMSASTKSAMLGGSQNLITGVTRAAIIGGIGLTLSDNSSSSTGSDTDHTYVSYLRIQNTPNGGTRFLTVDANGYVYSTGTTGGGGTGGSGTSGSSGANGTSGSSGTQGTSGSSGTNGTSGSSGTNGTSGSSGSRGTSGTSGSSGANGTDGSSGTSGTSGTSPAGSDGEKIVMNSFGMDSIPGNTEYIGGSSGGWNSSVWDLQYTAYDKTNVNCGVAFHNDIARNDVLYMEYGIYCGGSIPQTVTLKLYSIDCSNPLSPSIIGNSTISMSGDSQIGCTTFVAQEDLYHCCKLLMLSVSTSVDNTPFRMTYTITRGTR